MFIKKLIVGVIFLTELSSLCAKETVYIINGKKSLNFVSERFLSFSIEPDDFLENLNNEKQYEIFQHLKPALVRLSGQSTETIQFSSQNNTSSFQQNVITPKVWKEMYKWFINTGLTPIFTISNKLLNDTWSPNFIIPFLKINEEMQFSCYWQMRYDCNQKALSQYIEDLLTLKHAVNQYSSDMVIGGNLDSCVNNDLARKATEKLDEVVETIILDTSGMKRNSMSIKTPQIWLVAPQAKNPHSFTSALQWAKQVVESASNGYKVLFWKTSINLLPHSPVLWISLLYKRLVGQTVLDINANSPVQQGIEIAAYCAKQYKSKGAIVIFIVNSGSNKFTASITVAGSQSKNIDVQSYIVTATNDNTLYLNGEKLTTSFLNTQHLIFVPKLETVKVQGVLNLNVPSKSISFFVLPRAGIVLCGCNKTFNSDLNNIMEEYPTITSRLGESDKASRLDAFKKKLEEKKIVKNEPLKEIVQSAAPLRNVNEITVYKPKSPKFKNNKNTKLEIIFTEKPLKDKLNSNYPRQIALELTKDEIKQILLERAKSQALSNNIPVSNKQLEKKMKKATVQAQKYKRFATVSPLKRKFGIKKNSKKMRRKKFIKRDVHARWLKKKGEQEVRASGDIFADFAPSKFRDTHTKQSEEEVLKSGEKYVDERLKFLNAPGGVSSETEEETGYEMSEDFKSFYSNDKNEFMGEFNNKHSREGTKWTKQRRNKREIKSDVIKKNLKDKIQQIIVNSRRNSDQEFETKLKNLKEKLENRIKMNTWIRNKKKQNLQEYRRKRMSHDKFSKYTHYKPKLRMGQWMVNDIKKNKKMPSYSKEQVDEEFLSVISKPNTLRTRREIPYNDISQNVIEDEKINKIPKVKFNFQSSTVTPSTTIQQELNYTRQVVDNITESKETNLENTTTYLPVVEERKIFIKDIIDYVTEFIGNIYGKISNYFSG